jgi:hypothetical protein
MMIKFGFFDSVNGDRVYNADNFNRCIDMIASDGVFRRCGGAMQVILNTGMSVQVLDGCARFGGYWIDNDAFLNLNIPAASTQYARIDAVVIRLNISARTIEIAVKEGTAAETPTAPEMTRTETVKEYCLATVAVAANTTQIQQANITDTRGNANLCGWIKCGALVRYQSSKTLSTATTTMSIDISEYSRGDVLDVYRAGMYLIEGVDYTNNNDGTITFASEISSGTICCVVTKQSF